MAPASIPDARLPRPWSPAPTPRISLAAEPTSASRPDPVSVDLRAVKARKDTIVANSRNGVEKWLRTTKNVSVFTGTAAFASPTTLRVGGDLLEATKIFLNVGARPTVPNMPGVDSVPFLTSTTILDLEELPQHLIVVGGGYVGLEFAQMFRRFGSQVTIVDRKLPPRSQ